MSAHEPLSAKVLRHMGIVHVEQADECERLAVRLETSLEGPMTTDKLRELNHAWARGVSLCKTFEKDIASVKMP